MTQLSVTFLCPVVICILLITLFLAIALAIQDGMNRLKRLHQIPCSHCAFYTGDYRLKCAVHPCKAFSEEAIGCLDYDPVGHETEERSPATLSEKRSPLCRSSTP